MNNCNCEKKDDLVNIDDNNNKLNNAQWSSQYEEILVEWVDKAICYRWLHSA